MKVKQKQQDKQVSERKRKIFLLHRWDYIKQEQQKLDDFHRTLVLQSNFGKFWAGLRAATFGLEACYKLFEETKQEKIRYWKGRFLARKLFHNFEKFKYKKGADIYDRQLTTIRMGLSTTCMLTHKVCDKNAKDVLLAYIRDLKWRNTFLHCGVNYWTQILKISNRFVHAINMKKLRKEKLREMWENEK